MIQQAASYIFELDIHNFTTPPERKPRTSPRYYYFDGSSDSNDNTSVEFGSKTFDLFLGENMTKWKFKANTVGNVLLIDVIDRGSDFTNFTARASHLIAFDDEKPYFFDYVVSEFGKKLDDSLELPYKRMKELRSDLKSTMKIFIKLELIEGKFPSNQRCSVSLMPSKIQTLYKSKDFSDFTIICSDGVELNAHRCILSVSSPVLKVMMDIEMKESYENRMEVSDINGEVMDKILWFMYSHKIDDIPNHIEGLLYGAEKYQMLDLKEICISYMFTSLSLENAVKYFMLAHFYKIEHLVQLSLMYIQFYHEQLSKTDEWDELSSEQLELIQQHISEFEARPVMKYNLNDDFWARNFNR